MQCPVCKTSPLDPEILDSDLPARNCSNCDGHWINGADYWKWIESRGYNLAETPDRDHGLDLSETKEFIDCPECRWRMVKYLVGKGTGFALDHCQSCKGIWLDRNEWAVLQKRNLHDDLNAVLTAFWQSEALNEERAKRLEKMYISRFGQADYEQIKQIRIWLDGHEKKHELIAYLTDANPHAV
jgi:Zn-finger nucleic acid-binding protein